MSIMNKNLFILFISAIFTLSSCKTAEKQNELKYMQNAEAIAEAAANNNPLTIQKGDELSIFVSAKNMEAVRPFNQNYYNIQTPTTVASNNSEKEYLVNSEGDIDFPVIGKIAAGGKTLEAFREDITTHIKTYLKDPTVTVRLANFRVTVLGEVNRPGQFKISDAETTVLNALGLAGDLTVYGKRDKILLVRNNDGKLSKEYINLLDAGFVNSPYYNLKQGDVIYVSPNQTKEKLSRQDPNTNLYLAIAGTVIGLAGIFITIFKN